MIQPRNPQRNPRKGDLVWVGHHIGAITATERIKSANGTLMLVLSVALELTNKVPFYDQHRFLSQQFRLPAELKDSAKRVEIMKFFLDELIVLPRNLDAYLDVYEREIKTYATAPSASDVLRHIKNAKMIFDLLAARAAKQASKPTTPAIPKPKKQA